MIYLGVVYVLFFLQASPVQYYFYMALPTFLATSILINSYKLSEIFKLCSGRSTSSGVWPSIIVLVVNAVLLQIQVSPR